MPLHHLQLSKGRAKQMAARSTPKRFVQGAAGEAERSRAHGRAKDVKRRHGYLEALTCVANKRRRCHATSIEAQPRQRMWRYDLQPFGDLQAGIISFNDESGQPPRSRRFPGSRKDNIEIGNAAVGNPGLFAVEDEAISVAAG